MANADSSPRRIEPGAEKSYLSPETWSRGAFMLLFIFIWGLAKTLMVAIVLFQFAAVLLTREPNAQLKDFGAQLARFLYQVALFLTYNRDDRPWPFAPWGAGDAGPPAKSKRK